jgi:hypothetical protein
MKSGIMNLPMILSQVILSIVSGAIVSTLGYYTPFMLASSVIMAIGAGMISTFQVDTGSPKWIGYQILFGTGVGVGMQQPLISVQASLKDSDVPIGTAIMMFAQLLGGALFISVAQNVFQNELIENVAAAVPGLDTMMVVNVGATQLQTQIPSQYLPAVLVAYNRALVITFYVSVALGALSLLGSIFVPWNSVRGKKIEVGGAA